MDEERYTPQEPLGEKPENNTNSSGPTIGAIIVIVLLVALGIYVFTSRDTGTEPLSEEAQSIEEEIVNLPDAQKEALRSQGTSDELSEIEEDLNNTNLENLDAELSAVEEELEELSP